LWGNPCPYRYLYGLWLGEFSSYRARTSMLARAFTFRRDSTDIYGVVVGVAEPGGGFGTTTVAGAG